MTGSVTVADLIFGNGITIVGSCLLAPNLLARYACGGYLVRCWRFGDDQGTSGLGVMPAVPVTYSLPANLPTLTTAIVGLPLVMGKVSGLRYFYHEAYLWPLPPSGNQFPLVVFYRYAFRLAIVSVTSAFSRHWWYKLSPSLNFATSNNAAFFFHRLGETGFFCAVRHQRPRR